MERFRKVKLSPDNSKFELFDGEKSLGFFNTDKMAGYKIEEILKYEERNAVETAKAPADENIKDTDEKNNYRRNARRK